MGRFGPSAQVIGWTSSKTNSITIGATHTQVLYSHSFDLSMGTDFAFILKASGDTVNIKVELEQGRILPTTEAAADTTNYAVPNGASEIVAALTDTNLYIKNFSPVAVRYGRLKVTTLGAGSANQALTAYLSKVVDM